MATDLQPLEKLRSDVERNFYPEGECKHRNRLPITGVMSPVFGDFHSLANQTHS